MHTVSGALLVPNLLGVDRGWLHGRRELRPTST
jgi:hypothetical protein